jgi:membrane protease YdiL (CAAX protease family)
VEAELSPRVRRNEILIVLGISLGASAIGAVLDLINAYTQRVALNQQTVQLNPSFTPDRPYLDLAYQLFRVFRLVMPALLAIYLLDRSPGHAGQVVGLDRRRPRFDLATGAGLAALIGIPGIGLYVLAVHLGVNVNVAAATLTNQWWAIPVLVLLAAANAILEEVVVVGYLVTRLREQGWLIGSVVLTSALLRGSYHLYQGWGGFAGNAVMGVIFALFFLRFRRIVPLAIAHTLLDVGAFVGYTYLAGHISWLHA